MSGTSSTDLSTALANASQPQQQQEEPQAVTVKVAVAVAQDPAVHGSSGSLASSMNQSGREQRRLHRSIEASLESPEKQLSSPELAVPMTAPPAPQLSTSRTLQESPGQSSNTPTTASSPRKKTRRKPQAVETSVLATRSRKKPVETPSQTQSPTSGQRLSVMSPVGGDSIVLDAEDVVEDDSRLRGGSSPKASLPHTAIDMEPTAVPLKTTPKEAELLFIEDRKRYRRTTRGANDAMAAPGQGKTGKEAAQTVEAQVGQLLHQVNLISLAVSYGSYGLSAGCGLISLVAFPWLVPSVVPDPNGEGFLVQSTSAMLEFLAFYPNVAQSVANVFSLLSVLNLLYAMDVKHAESHARRSVSLEPGVVGTAESEAQRKSARRWVTSFMVLFAWVAFLATTIQYPVDDQLWMGAVSGTYLPLSAPSSQLRIRQSPFLLELSATANLTSKYPGQTGVLPWYWYYLAYPAVDATTPFPAAFQTEMLLWCILNAIRGLAVIACWLLALTEIRFRRRRKNKWDATNAMV